MLNVRNAVAAVLRPRRRVWPSIRFACLFWKHSALAQARASCVVIALVSPGYFGSKWCRKEVIAAKEANVPIVPVYAGDRFTSQGARMSAPGSTEHIPPLPRGTPS